MQVTSLASAWCAPCRTTSFRFLPTLVMSLSPLVSSMSSNVSTASNYFFVWHISLLGKCVSVKFKGELPHWPLSLHVIWFINIEICINHCFSSQTGIAKHFRYGSQEDAHEFLRYTVDAMQKSCLPGTKWVLSVSKFSGDPLLVLVIVDFENGAVIHCMTKYSKKIPSWKKNNVFVLNVFTLSYL